MISRRTFLRGLVGGAVATGGLGAYAHWAEPGWLQLDHRQIALGKKPAKGAPMRVLHLSDFHDSPVVPLEFIADAISLGLAQQPDLILLTGDFFTQKPSAAPRYATILKRLSAAAPTLACLGNHDGGSWSGSRGGFASTCEIKRLLDAAHIICLQNESHTLSLHGQPWQIIGVGDLWSFDCNPGQAFGVTPARANSGRILLNHNPDAKALLRIYDWDLMLCGHTHGGQVRLPLLGTPFAPVSDKQYVEGLHAWDGRWIYITRGVGNLHGVRFNCRPQVSLLDLA